MERRKYGVDVTSVLECSIRIKEYWILKEDGTERRACKFESVGTHEVAEHLAEFLRKVGDGEIYFPSFPVEPVNVQREVQGIRELLTRATIEILNLVRWDLGVLGLPNPMHDVEFSVSLDNKKWNSVGAIPLFRRTHNPPIGFSETWQQELQHRIDAGIKEPLSRTLLREANASIQNNPRASLVLSVAALEIGTKDCIAKLVPDSAWLLDNIPSPPIHGILSKYMPEMLSEIGNLSHFAPTKGQLKIVQDGIENRNTIVHKFVSSGRMVKTEAALSYLALEKLIWLCSDMLHLFDLYSGDAKAVSRISNSSMNEMIKRNGNRPLPEPGF